MMATAFMGYVLPWGQMSFWGATVITNLFSAFPFGESIVHWLWGGFAVDNPTLNRFYALHYLLPFLIVGVSMLHLIALHQFGSSNPLGIERKSPEDSIPFHPYYTIKDTFTVDLFSLRRTSLANLTTMFLPIRSSHRPTSFQSGTSCHFTQSYAPFRISCWVFLPCLGQSWFCSSFHGWIRTQCAAPDFVPFIAGSFGCFCLIVLSLAWLAPILRKGCLSLLDGQQPSITLLISSYFYPL
jgi:hypothetical protein